VVDIAVIAFIMMKVKALVVVFATWEQTLAFTIYLVNYCFKKQDVTYSFVAAPELKISTTHSSYYFLEFETRISLFSSSFGSFESLISIFLRSEVLCYFRPCYDGFVIPLFRQI
jgi:hypothetical protein